MKTRKIASVTIPRHYTLTVILTDETGNRFRVYREWIEPAAWDMSDPNGHYKMLTPPRHRKKLLERYADMASAMYHVYQLVYENNVE